LSWNNRSTAPLSMANGWTFRTSAFRRVAAVLISGNSNGLDIPSATNQFLVLERAVTNDAGAYHVVVTNALGVAASAEAVLTMTSRSAVHRLATDRCDGLLRRYPRASPLSPTAARR